MTALRFLTRTPRKRRRSDIRQLIAEPLEARCLLSASQGWDGPGLGSVELTYTIGQNPDSLSQATVRSAIETALQAWSNVADITFTPTDQVGLPDSIDITFATIDGPGGTLAQAYFPDDVNPPRIAGDIQFDISEAWEVGNARGRRAHDLVLVAVHEIGHALGLDHLHGADSVLQPSVSANQQFVQLSASDTAAIRDLYAAKLETPQNESIEDPIPTPSNEPTGSSGVSQPDDQLSPRSRHGFGWRWHLWVHWSRRLEVDARFHLTPYRANHWAIARPDTHTILSVDLIGQLDRLAHRLNHWHTHIVGFNVDSAFGDRIHLASHW